MSTVTPINENDSTISHYIGEIRPCKYCKSYALRQAGLANQVTHCRFCLSSGWVAQCLKCEGLGKTTSGSVWDGGKSGYTSTCNICGGAGTIPSREPKVTSPRPLPQLISGEKERVVDILSPSIPKEVMSTLAPDKVEGEEIKGEKEAKVESPQSQPHHSHPEHKGKKEKEKEKSN